MRYLQSHLSPYKLRSIYRTSTLPQAFRPPFSLSPSSHSVNFHPSIPSHSSSASVLSPFPLLTSYASSTYVRHLSLPHLLLWCDLMEHGIIHVAQPSTKELYLNLRLAHYWFSEDPRLDDFETIAHHHYSRRKKFLRHPRHHHWQNGAQISW